MNSGLCGQRRRANQSGREQYFSFHSFIILMFVYLPGLGLCLMPSPTYTAPLAQYCTKSV
jgi:hypothetical protein